jgi:hypothetical protein
VDGWGFRKTKNLWVQPFKITVCVRRKTRGRPCFFEGGIGWTKPVSECALTTLDRWAEEKKKGYFLGAEGEINEKITMVFPIFVTKGPKG